MKKLLLSILTLLYLASTTGAMLEKHFCMGQVADWSLGKSKGAKCGLCGMEKTEEQDNGCCSDQESFFKVTDDQKAQASIDAPTLFPCLPISYHVQRGHLKPLRSNTHYTLSQAPPGCSSSDLRVFISVFRI